MGKQVAKIGDLSVEIEDDGKYYIYRGNRQIAGPLDSENLAISKAKSLNIDNSPSYG